MSLARAIGERQVTMAARNTGDGAACAEAPPAGRRTLTVTDWNLGMIRKGGAFALLAALGLRPEVPEHGRRQGVFARTLHRLLTEHGPDVAFFQELFHGEDLACATARSLCRSAATHVQRMQKTLVQMNLQLATVISDITGGSWIPYAC
jgi:hypothetical protein